MKNQSLADSTNELKQNSKITVTKGNIGGCSIEMFVESPYEDFGSYIYRTVTDRDNDFKILQTLIK